MINGAHVILNSSDASADRAFFRDVLGWPHVDAGDGWLIFRLPPSEIAIHPAEHSGSHELYLMCDDIAATVTELERRDVEFAEPATDAGWGVIARFRLPGGGTVGVYEPRHERAVDL